MFEQHLALAEQLDGVLRVEDHWFTRHVPASWRALKAESDQMGALLNAARAARAGGPPRVPTGPLADFDEADRPLVRAWNESRPVPASRRPAAVHEGGPLSDATRAQAEARHAARLADLEADRELLTRPGDPEHSLRQVAAVCRLELDARALEEQAGKALKRAADRLRAEAAERRAFAADIDRATTPVTEWAEAVLAVRPVERVPVPTPVPAPARVGKW